jgi:hypothetical protein
MQDIFPAFGSLINFPNTHKAKHFNRPRMNSHLASNSTTTVTSPDDSFENNSDNGKNIEGNEVFASQIQADGSNNFEFDVKPKSKKYNTPEEYKKKFKTELCKNFQLKGWCKFLTKCSFAHGDHELREKIHLHTNYKTKKCKQFHQSGYCFYGYRCQYLHNEPCELKSLAEKWGRVDRYMTSTINCGTEDHEMVSNEQNNSNQYIPTKESDSTDANENISMSEGLERLIEKQNNDPNIPILHLLNCALRVRLPIFHNFTNDLTIAHSVKESTKNECSNNNIAMRTANRNSKELSK